MALSKPLFHLKTLKPQTLKGTRFSPFPSSSTCRYLSFATPEEAAAERRRRKRRLRIEPPLNSLRQAQPRPQKPNTNPNPNAPKLPDSISVLAGNRLNLHNRILKLIRENDLEEASLLVRHSIYSNCRPTVFTCNSVLAALLRQSRYSDLLSLHRFITQAGVIPNVVTHNLLINAYCDCRKTDTALEHYKLLINDAPFNPSPTTYRILVKGLIDNGKVERAVELNDEMQGKGLAPDPVVFNYLMSGLIKNDEIDQALALFDDLKQKSGEVCNGIVYGSLIDAYFKKGMEKEAMECYHSAIGSESKVKMNAVSYNLVLDALNKNGKFDEGLALFERMKKEHDPPKRITVNLGSYNVMVDGYCREGRFTEAIEVFGKMGEMYCSPDTLSYNNLIDQLGNNGMLTVAEKIYGEMSEKSVNPDEFTYILLIDACFKENRAEDASGYFRKMVESNLRPNVLSYMKVVDGLVKAGKIDDAKIFFKEMLEKELKPDEASYEIIYRGLCDANKLDDLLEIVWDMLKADEHCVLSPSMTELVTEALRKEGREDELGKLYERREKEKEEALAREAEERERAKAAALAKEAEEKEKARALAKQVEAATLSMRALGGGKGLGNNNIFADREEKKGDDSISDDGTINAKVVEGSNNGEGEGLFEQTVKNGNGSA